MRTVLARVKSRYKEYIPAQCGTYMRPESDSTGFHRLDKAEIPLR